MTPRRILITGACGFSGRHACRQFMDAGWEVIAAGSPRGAGRGDRPAAHHAENCDLRDGEAVLRMFRLTEPEAVLHLAGRNAVDSSWREPAASLSANLMATVNILEGVRTTGSGSCRVLIVGSMLQGNVGQLAKAVHPYGFSKTLQVTAARAWHHWYGLPVIVVEPSNLIGPGGSSGLCGKIARWAAAAEETHGELTPFALSSLHETRDFLDVRDAAAAYEILINKGAPGESYPLESGTLRTLEEVRMAFDEQSETKLPWKIGERPVPMPPAARDISLLRELGWQPAITFQQSIQDVLVDERRRRLSERNGNL